MKSLCCASSCVAVILLLLLNGRFQWVGGCLEDERGALLLFRDSVPFYNESAILSSWKGEDCCGWGGITCSDSTGRVASISLNDIDLSKFVNYTQFAVFKELQALALSYVGITRAEQILHVICELKHLRTLDLSGNSINSSIPPCLCDNQILETLYLYNNRLKGSIPSCLSNMKSLQSLDLSHNQLKEKIPSCLGKMKSLKYLFLSHNQLTGNIPYSIFPNLTNMVSIDLSNNQFSGVFSFSVIANLSNLSNVRLSNNVQLEVDTKSPTWVPSFQLNLLELANCNLNKQTNFIPSFISSQHSLRHLDLSHNSLEGKIPYWLLYNNITLMILRGNKFVGSLPSSHVHNVAHVQNVSSQLRWLDISDNQFDGSLSANNAFFVSNTLEVLNMSSNALDGGIPESMIFMKYYLRALDLSHNELSGEIPHWLAANNSVLQLLILSNNNFQGDMLPEDSNMKNLIVLRLDANNFTGSVPTSLVNSLNLMILDVGENNMSGDISNLLPMPSQLNVLFFGHNNLQGHISRHLCLLQQLRYLDLSGNHLSGDIPVCLLNITSMATENYKLPRSYWHEFSPLYFNKIPILHIEIHFNTKGASYIFKGKPVVVMNGIDLSFNKLTGSIPTEIGCLKGLHSLNLSHNCLIGHIPASFQYLKSLECLDLSYNHINGTIPIEMVGLDSLAVLNVSFNNLSGEIPSNGHFLTLNDPTSYMGNPGLCGRELENHCSSDNDTPSISHDKDDGEEKSSIMDSSLAFYYGVAISYILGFWSAISLLIFKKNWRYKFFKYVDVSLDRCHDKLWPIHVYLKNRFQSR